MPEHKVLDRAGLYGEQALWIRQAYMGLFKSRSITAVVRIGDRSDPTKITGLPRDVDLPVRFIQKAGNQAQGTPPQLFPDDGTTIRITDFVVKRIGDLTVSDLRGTAPDTAHQTLVRYHLATINDTELPSLDDLVTIWRFEYRPNATA